MNSLMQIAFSGISNEFIKRKTTYFTWLKMYASLKLPYVPLDFVILSDGTEEMLLLLDYIQ